MEFEYTDHEYLVKCTQGCGQVTNWLQSKFLAEQAIKNHTKENSHKCEIIERLRSDIKP